MSNLVINNVTYVIANDTKINRLSNFFLTPWLILKHEVSWEGHQVKWVQVDENAQTYQENIPYNYPRWIRIVLSVLLLIPASLVLIFLRNRIESPKYRFLRKKIHQENKEKYLAKYSLAQIETHSSIKDNWGTLSVIFNDHIGNEILLKMLEITPSFKARATLSLVNRACYQSFNSPPAWNITTQHLGLKTQFSVNTKEFNIYRNRLICQHELLENQSQNLRDLFDTEKDFFELPIIYYPDISYKFSEDSGFSRPLDIDKPIEFALHLKDLMIEFKTLPKETKLVRVITSNGYNALGMRCMKGNLQLSTTSPFSWLFFLLHHNDLSSLKKFWVAILVNETTIHSNDKYETKYDFDYIFLNSEVFQDQIIEIKQILQGEDSQFENFKLRTILRSRDFF